VMGNGSGMILNANGDILTNYHVVHGADRIVVTLNDGRKLPAKLMGKDPYTDLAVVRVTGKNLRPIPLGSSQTLRPGTWVLAVGSPLGFDHTVTLGIVSGISRRIPDLNANVDFIQTDAAINPGNSGGPLVNLKGQVVGINTAISGRAQNIGFAIPIDTAREVADALLTKGKVERPWVGVAMAPLSADLAESLGVPANTTGVVVAQVVPGSPAERSGLRPGDIVQRVNGQPVTDGRQIQQQVKAHAVGATLSLQVLRGSQLLVIKLQTEAFPDRMANQ
jgi:serine protease Do